MNIEAKTGLFLNEKADLLILPEWNGVRSKEARRDVDHALNGTLDLFIREEAFEANDGEWLLVPTMGAHSIRYVAILGLGEKPKRSSDRLRKAGAQIMRLAKEKKAEYIHISCKGWMNQKNIQEEIQAIVEGSLLGAYQFNTYKGKLEDAQKNKKEVQSLYFSGCSRKHMLHIKKGIDLGRAFAEATILARDLVNTPASEMSPSNLAHVAESIAKSTPQISITLLDAKSMKELGMNATLAVARGSLFEPIGVHLIYRPTKKTNNKIAIVGKAITFDSGGLSLKPADSMMTMKSDMSGAAAVLGLFKLLPIIKPNAEVHGIFLGVENMPSGNAYRPGDVVSAMNGVTIEILNTDAEGRVTLADALAYALTTQPTQIIDLATLTGACVVALGEEIAGFMSNNEPISRAIEQAAFAAGENIWRLPLFSGYNDLIKSKVADLKNIGGGRVAGAITAGLFLQHFVNKKPWVHLDIAGPAFIEKETKQDQQTGGTGFGVRLLGRYLQGL